jgi:hypothetical protein
MPSSWVMEEISGCGQGLKQQHISPPSRVLCDRELVPALHLKLLRLDSSSLAVHESRHWTLTSSPSPKRNQLMQLLSVKGSMG